MLLIHAERCDGLPVGRRSCQTGKGFLALERIGRYYQASRERRFPMSRHFRICLFAVAFFVLGTPLPPHADVNINIGIGAPPPLVIPSPPSVYVIPRTYAYFVPDLEVDIIFYQGYWYRPHGGHWYMATHYNGPWNYVVISRVPRVLMELPPRFDRVLPEHPRIPYGQLKSYWKTWENEKHWDKSENKKHHYKEAKREHKEHREGKDKGKH